MRAVARRGGHPETRQDGRANKQAPRMGDAPCHTHGRRGPGVLHLPRGRRRPAVRALTGGGLFARWKEPVPYTNCFARRCNSSGGTNCHQRWRCHTGPDAISRTTILAGFRPPSTLQSPTRYLVKVGAQIADMMTGGGTCAGPGTSSYSHMPKLGACVVGPVFG